MLRRLRHCWIIGITAIAFFATACVTTSNRLTPEVFNAMKSAEIFIVRAQQEIDMRITAHPPHADNYQPGGAYVHVPVNTGGGGGGGAAAAGILIFAAIAVAVANSVKQKKANEWIAPVREAVPDAEIEERLKRMIDRDFRAIQWIKPVPVPILDDTKSVVLEEKLYTSKADAVGLVTPYYQFDYSMTTLRVGMYFELFSASEALTKVVGKSQSQPIPYYAVHRYWDVSVPADQRGETEAHADYWSAENGKRTRAALAEGVKFVAAQIRETIADPQIYRPNQVIVKAPATAPEPSTSFKTVAERDNWYAIRFSEVETKWNEKGGGGSQEAMKRELESLAAECRVATISNDTKQRDEGCTVKEILEKDATVALTPRRNAPLIPLVSRFTLEPNAEGYRRLDTQEIKILFEDAYIENYPGHWQMEFSANGKWQGLLSNWGVTNGHGTWTAKDGLHCIEVKDRSNTWADIEEKGCFEVWIDEEVGNIRMIDRTVVSAWVLAKENAFGEVARLRETISYSLNEKPGKTAVKNPAALPKAVLAQETVTNTQAKPVKPVRQSHAAEATEEETSKIQTQSAKGTKRLSITETETRRPLKKGFRRLKTSEIKILFSDNFFNYPGEWNISFSEDGTWEGDKAGWNPIAGYGRWTAKNDRHCLEITDTDVRDFEKVDAGRCHEVWVNEITETIAFVVPEHPGKRIVVKEDATGDVERLVTMSN